MPDVRTAVPLFMKRNYEELVEPYVPDDETLKYIQAVYRDVQADIQLRFQPVELLGDRDLQAFWNESLRDWNVWTKLKRNDDWVRPYSSTIARDKSNTYIANIVANSPRPRVIAANSEQEIDRTASRVFKNLSDYAYRNDGAPGQNGKIKRLDYCTTLVTEGTVHVQEDVVDGECVRSIVENTEMLIPNYWQKDIQLQAHVGRITNNVLYTEAAQTFGHLENWKYVRPGSYQQWNVSGTDFFRKYTTGLSIDEGRVQILRFWYPVEKSRLKKGKDREKYFNILINGVPMFDWDNRMPYSHGYYPVSKGTFEPLHPSYYWGNSLPNKIRHDKRWKDSWKTLLRAKQKLSTLPPMVAMNGLVIEEDMIIPNKITPITGNINDLQKVPGVSEGISSADVSLLQLAEKEMEEGTASPLISGQSPPGTPPSARQVATVSAYAQINRGPYIDRFFALEAGLEVLRLSNIAQFYPKRKINGLTKFAVPKSELSTGTVGTTEIFFEPIPDDLSREDELRVSAELLKEEKESSDRGSPKEKIFIDPSYARNLKLYIAVEDAPSTDLDIAKEVDAYDRLSKNPVFNQEEVGRELIRALGKDEDRLIARRPAAPQPQEEAAEGEGQGQELMSSLGFKGGSMGPLAPETVSAAPARVPLTR